MVQEKRCNGHGSLPVKVVIAIFVLNFKITGNEKGFDYNCDEKRGEKNCEFLGSEVGA